MESIAILTIAVLFCFLKPGNPASIEWCNMEGDVQRVRRSLVSRRNNMASVRVTCEDRLRYKMIKCRCESYSRKINSCSGSLFVTDKHGRTWCKAYNSKGGRGVRAVAVCQRIVTYCPSQYSGWPKMTCPPQYKVVGCQLHFASSKNVAPVYARWNYPQRGDCCPSSQCAQAPDSSLCQVSATCLRYTGYNVADTGRDTRCKKAKPKPRTCRGEKYEYKFVPKKSNNYGKYFVTGCALKACLALCSRDCQCAGVNYYGLNAKENCYLVSHAVPEKDYVVGDIYGLLRRGTDHYGALGGHYVKQRRGCHKDNSDPYISSDTKEGVIDFENLKTCDGKEYDYLNAYTCARRFIKETDPPHKRYDNIELWQCKALCDAHCTCGFFEYRTSSKTCYLKFYKCWRLKKRSHHSTIDPTHYYKYEKGTSPPVFDSKCDGKDYEYDLVEHRNIFNRGFKYNSGFNITLSQCQEECNSLCDCHGVVYWAENWSKDYSWFSFKNSVLWGLYKRYSNIVFQKSECTLVMFDYAPSEMEMMPLELFHRRQYYIRREKGVCPLDIKPNCNLKEIDFENVGDKFCPDHIIVEHDLFYTPILHLSEHCKVLCAQECKCEAFLYVEGRIDQVPTVKRCFLFRRGCLKNMIDYPKSKFLHLVHKAMADLGVTGTPEMIGGMMKKRDKKFN